MATIGIPLARFARAGRLVLATLLITLSCASVARAETVVSFTFDDGTASQLGAASMLESQGMRGTFFVNSGTIAKDPYFMSWAQVDGLAATGHEIGGHTLDHKRLTTLEPDEQRRQICDDAAVLRARGYTITSFAYPFGAGTTAPEVQAALRDCGYLSARKVSGLGTDVDCAGCPFAESLPPANRYAVRSTPSPAGPITLADLQSWVTLAEDNGGGWLPLLLHDVCTDCGEGSVSEADLAAFIDWLALRAANGTVVKTVRQALAEGPQHFPPTTSITCNGAGCSPWFKPSVTVALSATDGGGGLGATRYTLDGTDPSPSSPEYTGPFTVSETTTVKFRTWDLGGNPEPVRSQTVRIDGAAPTGQIAQPADGARFLPGDITVEVEAADADSGVAGVELFVDGDYYASSASTTSPHEFTLPAGALAPGGHRLRALIIDAAGNRLSTALVSITLEDGLPATAIACDGAACPAGFVKGPVQVSLSATDGGGGLGATRYTLDGSDPTDSSTEYTAPFTLSETTTVKFRTWDLAGNAEPVKAQTLKLDPIAPTAQITEPVDGASLLQGDLTVKIDAADAGSGVAGVELFVDGDYYASSASTPYEFALPAGALAPGSHRLRALARDAAGNTATSALVNITIKDGLPTTAIACDGGACPAGFVKGPVQVTLSATDGGGGLSATRYTLDGTDPSPSSPEYTGPFNLSETTTVKFRTWDAAGDAEPTRTQTIKADGVAPTTQITEPANGASLTRGELSVKADAADSGSGVVDVELFVDGDWIDYSRSTTSPHEFRLAAGALPLGRHTLKVNATDGVGNRTSSAPVVVTITDGLPTTAISCDGAACSNDWKQGPVTVALAAADGGGGLGATRYTLDGTDPGPSSTEYAGPFTLSDTTTVKFRTWDLAGNAETVKSQLIELDALAPTAQITSPADGASIVRGDLTVTVDAADAGSGVADVELFVDADWVDYSRSTSSPYELNVPAATLPVGTHVLKVYVTDALGHRTSAAPVTVRVTDGLPATAIACDGAACPAGFVKDPVQVSFSATDGGGGLAATRYTLDGTEPSESSAEYTAPFALSETTTVKFRTWDLAGNAEAVKTQLIRLDALAPTAQITSPVDGASIAGGDIGVTVEAADGGSGIADVELFVDGDWVDYSRSTGSPYELNVPAGSLSLGRHTLKVNVTDALGNRTSSAPVAITVVDGLPVTAIACDGAACPAGFVKGPVQVSLSATDGGGGLAATRYTLDGTDPGPSSPEYTGPFTLTDTTTVKFRTWDLAGNAETVKSQLIELDALAPTAQITSPADGASVVRSDLTVNVDAADTGSGVADVELFVDGNWVDYSRSTGSPYELNLPGAALSLGAHVLKANVTDALGNRTSTAPITITVTDGLPATAIACDGAACPAGFVKGPVEVSLSATDGGGGLAATRYTLDGTEPSESSPEYTAPFTLSETTTVKFRTWDLAGNAEAVKAQPIRLDALAPTAQITSPADGASLMMGDLTVTVEAADTGSGVADVELFVDGDYVGESSSASSPYEFTLPSGSLSLGAHTLKVNVTDATRNRVSSAPVTITLKDGLPTTTIACDGAPCPSGYLEGPVNVTLAAIDGGTGVGPTRYTLDGTDPDEASTPYSGPFAVTESTTVKFRTWNSSGDAEPVKTHEIKLDSAPPTAQITSPTSGEEVAGDMTVKVDAADTGAGVASVELFVDGIYVDYSRSTASPYEIIVAEGTLAPGAHNLKANVTDALGHRTSSAVVPVQIKAPPAPPGPPTTTISCDGFACPIVFVKGPVTVTLAAIDGGTGVGPTRYTLDGTDADESSTEYTGPFAISETTTVKFRSWDTAGNAEPVRSQTIKIDSTPPTAQITSPTDGAAIAGDMTVEVDASDAGSGVASVDLYVDGVYLDYSRSTGSPYEIVVPAGTLAPGTHSLKVNVTDVLGNLFRSAPVSVTVTG